MSDVFEGLVRVERMPEQGMIAVRGDHTDRAVRTAVTETAGVDMPGQREARVEIDRGILWMSPDELAVLVPHAEAPSVAQTLQMSLVGTHSLVADVSDARAHFVLRGDAVREVIAKLAPVDMAPAAMPVGMIRRTRFAQVAASFWLRNVQTAQVFCFRSVGDYMADLLKTAAAPGSRVGYF